MNYQIDSEYELDDADIALIDLCRVGIRYENNGDPIKDVMDGDDLIEAVRLLVRITSTDPFEDDAGDEP